MHTTNTQECHGHVKLAINVFIPNGRSSQRRLGEFARWIALIFVLLTMMHQGLYADAADDLLKSLVDKSETEGAAYADVKILRDRLQADHPNSDQAAIGEAMYMGFLCDDPGVSHTVEMDQIFQALRQKGESKWYVVAARIALMCAYSQEAGKMPAAKALAREGIQLINVADLKTSYKNLIVILKASCGPDQFADADTDVGAWMSALQITADSD